MINTCHFTRFSRFFPRKITSKTRLNLFQKKNVVSPQCFTIRIFLNLRSKLSWRWADFKLEMWWQWRINNNLLIKDPKGMRKIWRVFFFFFFDRLWKWKVFWKIFMIRKIDSWLVFKAVVDQLIFVISKSNKEDLV